MPRAYGSFSVPREYNTRFLIVLRPEKLINFYNAPSANSHGFFARGEEATSLYGATRSEKRFRLAARDVSTHFRWPAKKSLMEFRRENDGHPRALCKSSRSTLPRADNCSRHEDDRASPFAGAHLTSVLRSMTMNFRLMTYSRIYLYREHYPFSEFYIFQQEITFCFDSNSRSERYLHYYRIRIIRNGLI